MCTKHTLMKARHTWKEHVDRLDEVIFCFSLALSHMRRWPFWPHELMFTHTVLPIHNWKPCWWWAGPNPSSRWKVQILMHFHSIDLIRHIHFTYVYNFKGQKSTFLYFIHIFNHSWNNYISPTCCSFSCISFKADQYTRMSSHTHKHKHSPH